MRGLAGMLAAVLALGGGSWWLTHRGSAPGESAVAAGSPTPAAACTGSAPFELATTAGYAVLARAVATAYTARKVSVDGACSSADVRVVAAGELAALAASAQPPAAFLTGPLQTPVLADLARTSGSVLGTGLTVARSVSVLAVPQPVAAATGWGGQAPTWADALTRLLDPSGWAAAGHPELAKGGLAAAHPATSAATTSAVGAIVATAEGLPAGQPALAGLTSLPVEQAMLSLVQRMRVEGATDEEVLAGLQQADRQGALVDTVVAAFVDERVVQVYNSQAHTTPLVAVYPADGVLVSDLTLTPVAAGRLGAQARAGLAELQGFLAGDAGRPVVEGAGYRVMADTDSSTMTAALGLATTPPATRLPVPDGLVRYALASAWDMLHNPGRFLLVLDASASMADQVPGTGSTKMALAVAAGAAGIGLMPPRGEMGLWTFNKPPGSTADWHELIPVGPAAADLGGRPRSAALVSALQGITPSGATPLYVTAIGAQKAMVDSYRPGMPNLVLLVSDGRNDRAGGPNLQQTVAALTAQTSKERPVSIFTIAYGANADRAALEAIAAASGGKSYAALDPRQLGTVLFGVLVAGFLGTG